ncbi:hypothetical protein FB451DRAFT_1176070 [Mycena latifolia]|nr:hypothetical protein FB451DRAFT_1176070 [Mycena latifolia]
MSPYKTDRCERRTLNSNRLAPLCTTPGDKIKPMTQAATSTPQILPTLSIPPDKTNRVGEGSEPDGDRPNTWLIPWMLQSFHATSSTSHEPLRQEPAPGLGLGSILLRSPPKKTQGGVTMRSTIDTALRSGNRLGPKGMRGFGGAVRVVTVVEVRRPEVKQLGGPIFSVARAEHERVNKKQSRNTRVSEMCERGKRTVVREQAKMSGVMVKAKRSMGGESVERVEMMMVKSKKGG